MRRFRVLVGSAAVCGCLFASGLFTGGAAAQSAEPVGGPLQLLKLMHPGKAESRPHTKLAAKPAAKSSAAEFSAAKSVARSTAKASGKTRIASRKKPRSYFAVAERKRHQVESAMQAAAAPASDNAWPAAPTAMAADATTLAPVQQMPTPPQIVAPTAGTPSQLVIDGQTVQVASADEANEIDLAASDASVANAASRGPKLVSTAPLSAVAEVCGEIRTRQRRAGRGRDARGEHHLVDPAGIGGARRRDRGWDDRLVSDALRTAAGGSERIAVVDGE